MYNNSLYDNSTLPLGPPILFFFLRNLTNLPQLRKLKLIVKDNNKKHKELTHIPNLFHYLHKDMLHQQTLDSILLKSTIYRKYKMEKSTP